MFNDETLMPFGEYKGSKLANVPASYLIWLHDNNKCGADLKLYIEENRDVLEVEIKRENEKLQ